MSMPVAMPLSMPKSVNCLQLECNILKHSSTPVCTCIMRMCVLVRARLLHVCTVHCMCVHASIQLGDPQDTIGGPSRARHFRDSGCTCMVPLVPQLACTCMVPLVPQLACTCLVRQLACVHVHGTTACVHSAIVVRAHVLN